jgi:hypothetical protein
VSVVGTYVRLPVTRLDELRQNPNWHTDVDRNRIPGVEGMDVGKACDGIAWLLSRLPPSPAPVEGGGFVLRRSLAPLLSGEGGREEPLLEAGYGPAQLVTPAEVVRLHQWLSGVDDAALRSVYQPKAMAEEGIYPQIWMTQGQAALDDYLIPHFRRLREFVADAAAAGQALLVFFA